jgi:hypothetical protein
MSRKTRVTISQCSICKRYYRGFGNNAYPYDGRCCDRCDEEHVQPHRLLLMNWKPLAKKEQQ